MLGVVSNMASKNPKYQIIVKNKAGDVVGEFSTWFNLKFGDKLNGFGTCTFEVPLTHPDAAKLVSLRRYETYIARDGQIVWSGEQANEDVTIRANDPNLITVTSYTLIEMLNSRFTLPYVRYDNTDQGQILKALVDYSQGLTNGSLGYTFASIPTTMNRDREYQLNNIFEAFVNMSNVINGIDFWVDHDKVIHIVPYRGVDKSAQFKFELGVNMLSPRITNNFSSPANKAWAVGATDGTTQLIESYTDTGARATYGLREQVISDIDVSESATLIEKAQDFVAKNKQQVQSIYFQQIPNTFPALGAINIGDSIKCLINKGKFDINSDQRIYGYDVIIGNNGDENVSWLVGKIDNGNDIS